MRRVAAVDQAVDHVAELPGVEPHVGRLFQPRHELDFGALEIERRLGQILAARRCLRQFAHHVHAELHELGEKKVNGRQIKNVVRTASALANNRQEVVGYRHLIQVLDMMEQFEIR